MIRTIYLDLDGVCNRFQMYALASAGCNVDVFGYDEYPSQYPDIVDAANHLLPPEERMDRDDFWTYINRDVWTSVPKSDEFTWLLEQCERLVGRENICILTKPKDPDSAAGKMEWICKNFPAWMHNQFLIGPYKHGCARPDALLIDDSDDMVDGFRAAGGQALLVPRPWNTLKNRDTITHLRSYFQAAKNFKSFWELELPNPA